MRFIAALIFSALALFTPAPRVGAGSARAGVFAKRKAPPPPPPPPIPPAPQFETQASYTGKVGGGAGAQTGMRGGGGAAPSNLGLVGDIAAAMSQVGKGKTLGG